MKKILLFLSAITLFIWAKWFASSEIRPELYGITIGIVVSLVIEGSIFLYNERNFLLLYINSNILKRNSEIRLSIAYIFKIESHGKYLLVKNNRFQKATYQPVGGVYKFFHPEAKSQLSRLSVITDNSIKNDDKSEYDMRLKMSKRKYLRRLIKWFFSSTERETSPWREFYEELIATNILPAKHFKYIYYDLVGQSFESIHKDPYYNIDTFKYIDVFTPRYVNQEQKEEIKKLLSTNSDNFIWVTEEEIKKRFSIDGKRISDHAHKIFFTKKINKC